MHVPSSRRRRNLYLLDLRDDSSVRSVLFPPIEQIELADHVAPCVKSANHLIRNIGKIHKYLTTNVARLFLVTSRLDLCNSFPCHLPQSVVFRTRKVQNTAARQVCRAPKHLSVTPLLHQFHLLPIEQRIK